MDKLMLENSASLSLGNSYRKEERTGLIFAASPEGGLRLKPLTSGRAD